MSRTPAIIKDVIDKEETAINLYGDWTSPEAELITNAWLAA